MALAAPPATNNDSDHDEQREELEERLARETASAAASADLVPVVGANLRRLRMKRGLSLERLAKLSNVSRAMLSQVELAYSAPSINVIWRIARALEVPFGALLANGETQTRRVLRKAQAKLLTSHDGGFCSRALFPLDVPRRTEFYELRLKGRAVEHALAHAPGTTENLVVAQGRLSLRVEQETTILAAGDAIVFLADVPHTYENLELNETVVYLVMTYAEEVGA
jgi:transcriptional regulator with XRE-family HTH domain